MKLFLSLFVTVVVITIAGCTPTWPPLNLSTPPKNTEVVSTPAVALSASPIARAPEELKSTPTPSSPASPVHIEDEAKPTATLSPAASPLPEATNNVTLTLILILDKNTYNLKEPVTATLRLTNSGHESVLVHKPMTWGDSGYPLLATVYVWLFDPNGKMYFLNKYIDLVRPTLSEYDTLDPNESIETTHDLRDDYELVLPGAYSIQLLYQNKYDPKSGEVSWKGEVWSNAVIFTVKP